MIPKRLHMIWLGGPRPLQYQADVLWEQKLSADWVMKVWGDDDDWPVSDRVRVVLDMAEDFAPANDAVRWRTDILRLALLNTYGGVYVDLDVTPLRSLDPLTGDRDPWVAESPNKAALPTNAAMGFPRRHRLLEQMLNDVDKRATQYAGKQTARSVGGWWIDELLPQHRDVEVMPWWLFASRSIRDRRVGKEGDRRNVDFGYMNHLYQNTAKKGR